MTFDLLDLCSAAQVQNNTSTGSKRKGGTGGLNKLCGVSPELQVIVGEPAMPRTQVRPLLSINLNYVFLFHFSFHFSHASMDYTFSDCEAIVGLHSEKQSSGPL